MLRAAGAIQSRRSVASAWPVVGIACAGQFLVVLDISVVNVALPSIRSDLALSGTALQWVVNAYAIAFAGFLLLGGRAGDLYGRKRMFLTGLALFTLASLGGGLAQEGSQLLVARAVQGIGAAVLAPSTLTFVTAAVPEGPARARAVATWTAVGAGGGAAGGLVGGVLVDGLSWRWVLLINVPAGVAVFAAAVGRLRESRADDGRRLDLPGALLATAGLATVAYGISQTEAAGWTAPAALGPLFVGLLLLAVFLLAERRRTAPLMPLALFRERSVSSANGAMFVCGAAMYCMWFFMTLYTQNVLDYTPLEAGLALVPSSLAVVVGSKLAPHLMLRAGPRRLAVLGALVAATGFAWQSTMTADGTYVTAIMIPGILMMLGAGLATTPLAALATSGAPPEESCLVCGLINTSQTMGCSLGLAVMSTIATARTHGGTTPEALTEGYASAFRACSVLMLAGALLMAVWLPAKGRSLEITVQGAYRG
ncbi:MFS transporter [Streptomyces sp. NPDC096205]|uniref:MFS transporter n=1 Tax=Streptomyces sp. NPDC096205 TaxID=3366081 RepID=UPI0037FB3245